MAYPTVDPQPDFPALEEQVLADWSRDDTFLESIVQREAEGADEFVFYDGPPFANGLPHYGHLLTGFVKDAVPRYQTMRGNVVHRRFGWDCHGLPAEVEAETELGIAGHPEITALRDRRVQRRLPHERAALHRRVGALRHPPGALGRLRQRLQDPRPRLHGERHVGVQVAVGQGPGLRGLQGAGVLLAVRDAAQQHRDAHGRRLPRPPGSGAHGGLRAPRRRRRADRRGAGAWTTTPWTLPANLALAVGPDIDYAVVDHDGSPATSSPRRGSAHYAAELGDAPVGRPRDRSPSWSGAATRRCSSTSPTSPGTAPSRRSRCSPPTSCPPTTAPASCTWRPASARTTSWSANAAGIPTVVPMDEHGRYTAEVADVGRRARVRRQPAT